MSTKIPILEKKQLSEEEFVNLTLIDLADDMFIELHKEDTITKAIKSMYSEDTNLIVIVDNERRPIGVFTEEDLVRRVDAIDYDKHKPIEKVMTKHPECLPTSTGLFKAAKFFLEHNYNHVPVINDEGQVAGVLSKHNVLWFMVQIVNKASYYRHMFEDDAYSEAS